MRLTSCCTRSRIGGTWFKRTVLSRQPRDSRARGNTGIIWHYKCCKCRNAFPEGQAMTRRYVVPAVLLTFLILLAVPAFAQDEVQAIGACTVIEKPGSYVLGNDIKATLADLKRVVPDA